jgi:hypothetical protein
MPRFPIENKIIIGYFNVLCAKSVDAIVVHPAGPVGKKWMLCALGKFNQH